MRWTAAAVPMALLVLTGCGQSATSASGVDDFRGEDKKVAQVVADLSDDGSRGDEAAICKNLISSALSQRISEAGTTCAKEINQAISDADGFDLKVTKVNVQGSTATAEVEGTDRGKTVKQTFTFSRDERGTWKILRFAT